MRWEKIIPVVLFLLLTAVSTSSAWQETIVLNVVSFDMPQSLYVSLGKDAGFLELNEITIDLEPLVPISHSIEAIVCSQKKTLKSS